MPSPSDKVMAVAANPAFQSRVKLALVKTALVAIGDDQNSARSAFARKVLTGTVNLPMAAVAVAANASVGASIAAAEEGDESFGVGDDDIAFIVAEGGNPATGVFDKLARASAGS